MIGYPCGSLGDDWWVVVGAISGKVYKHPPFIAIEEVIFVVSLFQHTQKKRESYLNKCNLSIALLASNIKGHLTEYKCIVHKQYYDYVNLNHFADAFF